MAYSASPPGFLLCGQKKRFFAEATLEIHCLEDVSILPIRAANQNTGLASSCQLAREFSHIMKGTTCRIKKKFSRRSNSNRKKYQHGTKSIKHSGVLCAFGNVHLHYLLAIETYCAWFHTSSLYKKVSFCKGHL